MALSDFLRLGKVAIGTMRTIGRQRSDAKTLRALPMPELVAAPQPFSGSILNWSADRDLLHTALNRPG